MRWASHKGDKRRGRPTSSVLRTGTGLNLLGSVSLAPPLDLTVFADAAAAGDLTKEQRPGFAGILAALKDEYASFNLDDYRRGIVQQQWDLLLSCDVRDADARCEGGGPDHRG